MSKKTQIRKKIDGVLEILHPETESNIVYMGSGNSLESDFSSLSTSVSTLSTNLTNLAATVTNLMNRLDMEQIYVTDDNDVIVTDDEGTNLIAVY